MPPENEHCANISALRLITTSLERKNWTFKKKLMMMITTEIVSVLNTRFVHRQRIQVVRQRPHQSIEPDADRVSATNKTTDGCSM
jgi:hypothetical protein